MEVSKSRCRENVENVAVIIDNVSYYPDLAQDTPYMRPKTTASSHAHSALSIITVSIPPIVAMLVTNFAFRGIISVWQLNGFVPFKDTDSIKQEDGEVEISWHLRISTLCVITPLERRGEREERSGATANGILCEGVEESVVDIREVSGSASVRKPQIVLNVVIAWDGYW